MKNQAIRVHETGGSDALKFSETPVPVPNDDDVLIRLEYAGINFIDVYFRTGVYKAPSFPYIPGKEGVGIVEAVGKNVSGFSSGERVGFCFGANGSYAEYTVEKQEKLIKIPPDISADTACAVLLQGFTAHYLVHSTYPLKPGHSVLIHAAAGGVGQLLCQMAKNKGASVFATVSNDHKKALAEKCGADHVVIYDSDYRFSEQVLDLSGGKKLDAVYDSVGKPTFEQGLGLLRPRGYMVLFGQSGGVVPPFDLAKFNTCGSLFFTRPTLAHYVLTPEETAQRASSVFSMIREGKLSVEIGNVYALENAKIAHDDLEGRKTTGKSLLKISKS